MNGKTARALRKHIGAAGTSEYEVMPGTQRHKMPDDPRHTGPGVRTCTIHMQPDCGRKRYQALKRTYRAARTGEMFGSLSWPTGL